MYKIIGADQREYGPVTADQIRQWIADGRANAQTRARLEGTSDWRVLSEFPEFSDLVGQPPPAVHSQAGGAVPPPPPAYGYEAAPVQKTNGMAVAGFIFGLLGLVQCCMPVFGVLGLIFSLIGRSQINRSPEQFTGKGWATAGLILSIIGLIISVILFLTVDWNELFREFQLE